MAALVPNHIGTHLNHHRQQQSTLQHQLPVRGRRTPRAVSNSTALGNRHAKPLRELTQESAVATFRARFESGRSFEDDDDFEFVPNLLSDDEYQYLSASSSEKSSLASNSPDLSPAILHSQPNQHVPTFSTFNPSAPFFQFSNARTQESVGSGSGFPVKASSPPASVSPTRLHQPYGRRW